MVVVLSPNIVHTTKEAAETPSKKLEEDDVGPPKENDVPEDGDGDPFETPRALPKASIRPTLVDQLRQINIPVYENQLSARDSLARNRGSVSVDGSTYDSTIPHETVEVKASPSAVRVTARDSIADLHRSPNPERFRHTWDALIRSEREYHVHLSAFNRQYFRPLSIPSEAAFLSLTTQDVDAIVGPFRSLYMIHEDMYDELIDEDSIGVVSVLEDQIFHLRIYMEYAENFTTKGIDTLMRLADNAKFVQFVKLRGDVADASKSLVNYLMLPLARLIEYARSARILYETMPNEYEEWQRESFFEVSKKLIEMSNRVKDLQDLAANKMESIETSFALAAYTDANPVIYHRGVKKRGDASMILSNNNKKKITLYLFPEFLMWSELNASKPTDQLELRETPYTIRDGSEPNTIELGQYGVPQARLILGFDTVEQCEEWRTDIQQCVTQIWGGTSVLR